MMLLFCYPLQLPFLVLMAVQQLQLAAAVCLGHWDFCKLSGITATVGCHFQAW